MALVTRAGGVYAAFSMGRVYITDSFDRADSSTIGNTDTGETWLKVIGTGNMGIASNQAKCITAGDRASVVVEAGTPDVEVTATISTVNLYEGLVFRYVDDNNYWNLTSNNFKNSLFIGGKTSGTNFGGDADGWRATGLTITNGSVIKIRAVGTSLKVYHNGTLVLDVTKTEVQTGTKHGFFLYDTTARMNDFSIVGA